MKSGGESTNKGFYFAVFEFLNKQITKFVSHFFLHRFQLNNAQNQYPNRDKPYTEDLGKITFRPSITAYVVGDDCFDQRDRLIDALNKPGPGTLVHPTYGELKVCVDGEVRVSTSKSEGRIVRFDLKFVEAGELSYPTSGAATAQTLMSSCSALDDCISDSFSGFSIDGVADFVQNDVVGNPGHAGEWAAVFRCG
ncbi:hypothetical protein ESCOMM037M2_10415 [Escherichia coli]